VRADEHRLVAAAPAIFPLPQPRPSVRAVSVRDVVGGRERCGEIGCLSLALDCQVSRLQMHVRSVRRHTPSSDSRMPAATTENLAMIHCMIQ
jgi:hypothetical protein